MSFTAVGGDTKWLWPTEYCSPADAHYQCTIWVKSPTDCQGVHILREKGLVGECVTDASIIKYLKDKRQIVRKELSCGVMLKKVKQRGYDEKRGQ